MRALVTGGGGFLGGNIVARLRAEGHEVAVLGRNRYPAVEALGARGIIGDVRDADAVAGAVAGMDVVFHVAARVGYWGAYEEYRSINVDGTRILLDAARAAGVGRFVYTSSPSVVIGDDGAPEGADESLPYPARYLSPYGPTKAEAERLVLGAHEAAMGTVVLRPHFIFGPKDPQVAPRLVARSKEGRLAQVGDGTNRVDVTYIDDCVDAHLAAAAELSGDARCGGKAYFLGGPEPVRLWDFAGRILEGFGAPPVERRLSFKAAWAIGWALEQGYRVFSPDREPPLTRMAAVMLGTSHWFDHSAARRDFGWTPQTSLDVALERTFAAGLAAA